MKTMLILTLLLLLALPAAVHGAAQEDNMPKRIRIVFEGKEAVVTLLDTAAAKDLLAQLPLSVTFEDFAGAEKITYTPQKLDVQGSPNADAARGDFCYYAPWGNIAVFYKGMGHGTSLYVLGRLESGKEALAGMGKAFAARMEILR